MVASGRVLKSGFPRKANMPDGMRLNIADQSMGIAPLPIILNMLPKVVRVAPSDPSKTSMNTAFSQPVSMKIILRNASLYQRDTWLALLLYEYLSLQPGRQ